MTQFKICHKEFVYPRGTSFHLNNDAFYLFLLWLFIPLSLLMWVCSTPKIWHAHLDILALLLIMFGIQEYHHMFYHLVDFAIRMFYWCFLPSFWGFYPRYLKIRCLFPFMVSNIGEFWYIWQYQIEFWGTQYDINTIIYPSSGAYCRYCQPILMILIQKTIGKYGHWYWYITPCFILSTDTKSFRFTIVMKKCCSLL